MTLVSLDPGRLPPFGQLAWLQLLRFALDVAGVRATLRIGGDGLDAALADILPAGAVECAPGDLTPGPDEPCVHLSGSEVLSTRLLRRFGRMHIAPSDLPRALESRLYWHARASGELAARLNDALRMLGSAAPWSDARNYLASLRPARRRVALISSIFAGDEYLPGFLENSAGLEGYGDCEHFLVRPGSPGDEHEALLAHARQWPCAVYINLTSDPGLYEVWNLCTRLATAPYLSNANVDDRRAPAQVNRLACRLDDAVGAGVAHGALRVTQTRNLAWSESGDCPVWYADGDWTYGAEELLREDGDGGVRDQNRPHCMPLWRRELHAFHGGFREREWGPSADWEFWLRVGTAGVRFAQVAEPLGLYLKDAASYWQRGSAGGGYNARIVDRYAPPLLRGTPARARPRPLGLQLAELREHAHCGAWFELVVGLLQCARRVADRAGDATAVQLVDRMGWHYLGVSGLAAWAADDARGALRGMVDTRSALAVVVDLLHRSEAGVIGDPRSLPARVLWGALIDLHVLGGDQRGLLGCALLRRWQGDAGGEGAVLAQVQQAEGPAFWGILQDVYRFAVPLAEMAHRLTDVRTCADAGDGDPAGLHLAYFPDFRGNPYQQMLYQGVVDAGGEVRPLAQLEEIDALEAKPGWENVLHIHWLQGVFARVEADDFTAHGRAFLDRLDAARRRGFRIAWTVHNELNHESVAPAAEWKFRRRLAGSVDRVYVHHPMIPQLVDWLPADCRPWLVEHGPFPGPARTRGDQEEARAALGLPQDAFLVVTAGRVRDYKALDRYVPVFRQQMAADRRLRLAVVGPISSASARAALATLPAGQRKLRNAKVSQEEFETWLRAADYAFFSYRAILTSGSLFHALSLGVPVIAPTLGTIPAYVVHGWNGFLYDDPAELAGVLQECASHAPGHVHELGANAALTASRLEWHYC